MRSLAAVWLVFVAAPALAQTPAVAGGQGQAYFEFLEARRLEAEGDIAGALAALERAEALDPKAAGIFAERAALHARNNDGPAARAAAERALALDTDNAEAHHILGLVFAAWAEGAAPPPPGETVASLRARAIDHLKAIRSTPAMATDLSLQIAFGRLLLRAGSTDEAVTVLEGVVSQAPYIAEPFALLAEARTAQGRMFEAAEALAQAAQVNPRYYVSLGELYERLGRWAAAAGAYGQAVEGLRSPTRELRLRHITALLNVPGGVGAGRAKEALAGLLEANPNDTRLLYLQSAALRQLRDLPGAERAARQTLAIDPTSLAGLNALARCCRTSSVPRGHRPAGAAAARRLAAAGAKRDGDGAGPARGWRSSRSGPSPTPSRHSGGAAVAGDEAAYSLYLAQALMAARHATGRSRSLTRAEAGAAEPRLCACARRCWRAWVARPKPSRFSRPSRPNRAARSWRWRWPTPMPPRSATTMRCG